MGENHEKRWRWLATFLKNAGGERVNVIFTHKTTAELAAEKLSAAMKRITQWLEA